MSDELVTAAQLSTYIGVSVSRINKLRQEEILTWAPEEEGKFELKATIKAYCTRLRDQASGRISALDQVQGEGSDGERLDPIQEGARLKARQADMLEIKLSAARGELLPMSDMLEVWQRILSSAKSKLMGLAASLPTQIHGLGPKEVEIIRSEIHLILEQLAEDGERAPEQAIQLALEE